MKFKEFSKILQKIEDTASRNDITVILSELFGSLDSNNIDKAMYFIQGRLAPKYVDLEFNMSRKLILKALDQFLSEFGDNNIATKIFKSKGDIGITAQEIIEEFNAGKFQTSTSLFKNDVEIVDAELSIEQVFGKLLEVANYEGSGSQESKINGYISILKQSDSLSIKYVTRVIVGDLRLGVSDKTTLDAISWHEKGDKSLRLQLDKAFGAKSDIGKLAKLVISTKDLEKALKEIKLEPGVPVASKLVERESSTEKVWERMPNCYVQPKLDGLRGQLHFKIGQNGLSEIYSRNMESLTGNFPELIESMKKLGVESIILDSEIIGVDNSGKYLTYQETMQRRRKYDVDQYAKDLPVKAMCFDILYLNGKDLSQEPIEKRINLLEEILKNSDNLKMLETKQVKSVDELEEYFKTQIYSGLEGIIAKQPGTEYDPGTRNYKWIKLKANSVSELVDTIDVAVMGYYIGRGKRAQFGIGAILTGVYDPETDKYFSIGKVGTGIKDELFKQIKIDLDKVKTDSKPENYIVDKTLEPDVWVQPEIIAEVDADEITRSPNHTTARGVKANIKKDDSSKGLSIRFPRLKIWKRDKDLPNTVAEIIRMYELRKNK